jgi:hypothetical protein
MRSVYCSDQLVKFQLHRGTVPILSVLDQEHHEERDDGRAGIYNQLPGIAEGEYRAGGSPNQDDEYGENKGCRVSCSTRSPLSKSGKAGIVIHDHSSRAILSRKQDTTANHFPRGVPFIVVMRTKGAWGSKGLCNNAELLLFVS